ncbi:hypothetical protein, partial [Porphyromonas sp.]|uniref:hypothetical protein n=1 Tax=Porphyromonas sp. TaxID=1924944 RepID=UPI003996BC02
NRHQFQQKISQPFSGNHTHRVAPTVFQKLSSFGKINLQRWKLSFPTLELDISSLGTEKF